MTKQRWRVPLRNWAKPHPAPDPRPRERSEPSPRFSGAFLVGAFGGVDADLFAFGDEGRDLYHQAGFHLRRLGHVGYRGALEPGFGFHYGHIDGGRQFHADRVALVELDMYL